METSAKPSVAPQTDQQIQLELMSKVKQLSQLYSSDTGISKDEKDVLKETIFIGQTLVKGFYESWKKVVLDHSIDEGDLYLVSFFKDEAKAYLSVCSKFLAEVG